MTGERAGCIETEICAGASQICLFHRKVRPMKQKGMRSFARGTKAAPAGKLGRGSVRSALLFIADVILNLRCPVTKTLRNGGFL